MFLLFVLVWAPWLNDQELRDRVFAERAHKDGTILPDGTVLCDYQVSWFPFGRWVASCEGGVFVTFYGQIII